MFFKVTSKVIYARTRTYIFENFPAPICTKIAAPTRARVRAKGLGNDIPRIALVMVRITFPGGGSNVPQRLERNNF